MNNVPDHDTPQTFREINKDWQKSSGRSLTFLRKLLIGYEPDSPDIVTTQLNEGIKYHNSIYSLPCVLRYKRRYGTQVTQMGNTIVHNTVLV